MAIGPVQLIVLGFPHRDFHGEIVSQLERLRDSDTVRVIGALAVHKDAEGEIEVEHLSHVRRGRGDRAERRDGRPAPLDRGGRLGRSCRRHPRRHPAAALLLIEHRWVVPLRDAIARAGGFRISDGFISPLDLIEIGLVSPEEAEALLDAIKGATAPTSQNLRPGGDFGRQAPGMSLSHQGAIASEDRSDRGSPPEDCHRNLWETDKCSMTRRASAAWKPPTTLVLVPAGTTSAARALASWRAWPS